MWLMNGRCLDSKFDPTCLPWTEEWNTAPASPLSEQSNLEIKPVAVVIIELQLPEVTSVSSKFVGQSVNQ